MRTTTHIIRIFLYLLLAAPFIFVGCERTPQTENGGKEEENLPKINLSTQQVRLSAEGGEFNITYTIENERENMELSATCEAIWIRDISITKENITFTVDDNEYDHRQTTLKLSYDTITEEVVIEQEAFDGINFRATILSGEYYSAESLYWSAHNYYFTLSDAVIDRNNPVPNSTYFYFDLYSESATEDFTIPQGRYTYDPESQWLAGTLNGGKTYGFRINSLGTDYAEKYFFTEGEVVVSENSIEARFLRDDGKRVIISYEGELTVTNRSPEDEEYLSTLSGDVELNCTDMLLSATYYGSYYTSDTDNWTIRLYEDPQMLNGIFIQLELLADPSGDWNLNYHALEDNSFTNPEQYINTFIKGYLNSGQIAGSWYAVLKGGAISYNMAPITGGTIDVIFNTDGSKSFILDCTDDAGNKISGILNGSAK